MSSSHCCLYNLSNDHRLSLLCTINYNTVNLKNHLAISYNFPEENICSSCKAGHSITNGLDTPSRPHRNANRLGGRKQGRLRGGARRDAAFFILRLQERMGRTINQLLPSSVLTGCISDIRVSTVNKTKSRDLVAASEAVIIFGGFGQNCWGFAGKGP